MGVGTGQNQLHKFTISVLEHFKKENSIIMLTSKCWQSENPVAAPV